MLIVVGLFYGYAFTSFASVTQQSAPDEMRGRVLAVNFLVLGILFPVGTLIQGQIADAIGLRWTTAGSGRGSGRRDGWRSAPWQRRAAALVTS